MRSTHQIWAILVLLVLLILLAIFTLILPDLFRSSHPAWVDEAVVFLVKLKDPLKQYADANGGNLPRSLSELYPRYTEDIRVTKPILSTTTARVAVIYWAIPRANNEKSVLVEMHLDPSMRGKRSISSILLLKDFSIDADK